MNKELFVAFLCYFLDEHGICSNFFCLSFFMLVICVFFSYLAHLEAYKFYLYFQRTSFLLIIIFLYCFPVFNFIDCCFISCYCFSSAYFGFNLLYFFQFPMVKAKMINLRSPFLIYVFYVINFLLISSFTESHTFLYIVFHIYLVQNILKFLFQFPLSHMGYLEVCFLIFNILVFSISN